MFNLVLLEMYKLKKSKTILFIILSSLLFPILWCLITPFNTSAQTWLMYTAWAEDIMFLFGAAIVFVLLSSHIFLREYSYDTVNLLYSYPVSKISIFISKLLTIYILTAFIYILHFSIVFGGGLIVVHNPLTRSFFLSHLAAYIISMLLEFSIVPLIIFLINILKNTTVSICIAITILLSNFCMYQTKWYAYWPLLSPYIPMMKLHLREIINLMPAINTGIITLIVGILLCIFQLSRKPDA